MRHLAAVTALLLIGTQVAHAETSAEIPDDVARVFSSDFVQEMNESAENSVVIGEGEVSVGESPVDFSGVVGFGACHEVFLWDRAFIIDGAASTPFTTANEWIVPALAENGNALGIAMAWRPAPEAKAEVAGYSNDTELGNALEKIPEGAQLVHDPTIDGWYFVQDGMVTALNSRAATEVLHPMPLKEFQKIIGKRWADREAAAASEGGGATFAIKVILLILIGMTGFFILTKVREVISRKKKDTVSAHRQT